MEIAPDNSKAAVPDTVLQEINVSSGASTFGAAETPALGSQFPSPSLETRAVIPTSSSLYYTSFYPYTVENMSLALAESSTAPMNFFSSLPVTSVISCSSAAESQVSTSISHDSPCFNFDPEYCPPFSVSLPGTAACSSAFPSTFADASVGFQRCASSFGSAQADIRPVYASSESATAICVSSSRLQSTVQPQGTTAVMSPSLRILEGYCGDLVPASPSDSAVPENPSLLIVSDGTDDSTSLRLVDDSHDPTLLGVADELDDLSASHRHVPLHSAEIPTTVVELPPQSSITAEELSSLRIPSETIAETVHPLPTVGVVYSSAHSEPPVGASTDLSIERSSSLPPTRPPSGTSMIMSPFIVELARGFPSQLSSSFIVPKIEPHDSPLLIPKLEPLDTTSGSAASYRYFSVVMVPSSLDPNCESFSGCPDLRLYASSSEPSSPSCPSSSSPSSGPACDTLPDCPELEPCSPPEETNPLSTSALDPLPSERMVPSTSEAPSTCSPSSAVSHSNSLTSSPCDSHNCAQTSEPMECSPSLTSDKKVENSTPGKSRKDAPLPPNEQYPVGEYEVNSEPPPLPGAEVVPRGYIGKGQKGIGWPYAPQGWPNRDDKWPWRVGKRGCPQGFYKDRFLGLPISLVKEKKLVEFSSKRAVVRFLQQNFPHLDVDSFFKAFQWRIPCVIHRNACPAEASPIRGEKRQREADLDERTENPAKRSRKQCRAGNLKCGMETGRSVLLGPVPGLDCDICCVEPGFCRECTCILCCKTIVPDGGECNVVRCMQRPLAGGICGHGAHLECALESQMAGVVKKRGLDMEYLCRRCDRKTDLRELVTRLLEAVGNTVQGSVAEKCLQLALQIMQGTEHGGTGARVLESLVQAALRKVQSGVDIQEVFSDLRDQGIAAEAAKHQCLGRASSNGEDGSQQPEASLDQWLPSSGSPSSHPSPGTPSSFSSPIIRRNLSVNSPADGPEGADHGNHRGVDGHTGESGAAVRNPGSKFSSPASEPSSFKPSQARVCSHRGRAGSSSSDGNQEATCGSQAVARNGKFSVDESGPRSLHLGMKKSDHKGPIAGAGAHGDEHCRSCGVRRPACPGLEVTSSLKFPNAEDGGDKSHCFSPAGRKGELTPQNPSRHTHDAERETNHGSERSQCTSAAVVSLEGRSRCNVLGVSLRLLDEKCQQQVQSVLQKLRQAQQMEFLRAQERLIAQKDTVLKQYELLETARNQYDGAVVSSSYHLQDFDHLMLKLSNQLAKASEERQSFEKMFKIAQGFGKLSKEDLSKLFGWATEREVESHD